MPHHTQDSLHTKLAEVYTLNQQFDDALESFHFAIRYGAFASLLRIQYQAGNCVPTQNTHQLAYPLVLCWSPRRTLWRSLKFVCHAPH